MKKKQRHGGRPPLPRDQVRGQRIVTFVNETTGRQLEEIASRNGSSISLTCCHLIERALASLDQEQQEQSYPEEKTSC